MAAASTQHLRTEPSPYIPDRSKRRLSQTLFAFFQTVAMPDDGNRPGVRPAAVTELRRQDVVAALDLRRQYFTLPADLKLVPDRVTQTATIRAAGFADSRSVSVGVDIASWSRPCAPNLDEIGWRRVFTWIVGTDTNLTNVSILEPPAHRHGRLIGSYSYDADGIPGYGVLQVAAPADGSWKICDCWGDAAEADRVDDLVSRIGPC